MENRLKKKYFYRIALCLLAIVFLQYRYCLFYRYTIDDSDFVQLNVSSFVSKKNNIVYYYGLNHFCKNYPKQYQQCIEDFTQSIIDTSTYNETWIEILDISKFYSEEIEQIKSGYLDESKLEDEHRESYIYYRIHKKKLEENTTDKHEHFHWYIPEMKYLNPPNPLEVDPNIQVIIVDTIMH